MVNEFRDEYSWLSNFQYFEKPKLIKFSSDSPAISFPTAEHFYQAMKVEFEHEKRLIAKHPSKGLKSYVKTFNLRPDWDEVKIKVMLYITRYKYSESNPNLRRKLIETGNEEIKEGNYWGDKFWGVCLKTGEGQNNLGLIIMKVRGEILNANQNK